MSRSEDLRLIRESNGDLTLEGAMSLMTGPDGGWTDWTVLAVRKAGSTSRSNWISSDHGRFSYMHWFDDDILVPSQGQGHPHVGNIVERKDIAGGKK